MQVQTGKGTIAASALVAILSISLVVNLPGLAITPMLASLHRIFPDATELEVQLLTSLPNFMIIPFVLLAGKLSLSKSKIALVFWALLGFTLCGVAYFFAKSMTALIIISCLLGCSCGLLIPLAAGLLSDTFVGAYRMKQLGIKSSLSNISLVIATYVVGWLSYGNWHLPFAVYLFPVIPLVLTPFLRKIPKSDLYPEVTTVTAPSAAAAKPAAQTSAQASSAAQATSQATSQTTSQTTVEVTEGNAPAGGPGLHNGFYVKRIWALIGVYFFICYWIIIISYYLPFLMSRRHMATSNVGLVTAIFFFMIFLPGATLPWFVRKWRGSTLTISALIMLAGSAFLAFIPTLWSYIIGAALLGLGYGIFQPLIYDKTTLSVTSERKATLALAFVLAANYLANSICPFIVDGIAKVLGMSYRGEFPFVLNLILGAAFTLLVIFRRHTFAFSIPKSYYAPDAHL